MSDYKTLDDVDVGGRRVLVRSDLNVPLQDGAVADDFRIRAALGTISRLSDAGARVIVCSHLGRPKGVDPALSLAPVADRLSELGGFDVRLAADVAGPSAAALVESAGPGSVVMLENTRFEHGETANDPDLALAMARLADIFVQDAFGSVHRAHASTVGVAELVLSVAGPLLVKELQALGRFLGDPDRPYVVVLGGAKISDKLGVIRSLLPRTDTMLVGGGMCFSLLAARGVDVGASLVEDDQVDGLRGILDGPDGHKIVLPTDVVVAERFAEDAARRTVAVSEIPDGWMGLDIGPDTAATFAAHVEAGASVFWNGPMGVFEWEPFRAGTLAVAEAMVRSRGFTAVGGGDSAAALRLLGLEDGVDHLSTGGGAGLELLEGRTLPGVAVLRKWADE